MAAAATGTPAPVSISFDLLHAVKELQLQYGLRSDDFERYHKYLTGRISTLRKQLKLTHEVKVAPSQRKAQTTGPQPYHAPKPVVAAITTEWRHVLLAALLSERCWAESEVLRARHATSQDAATLTYARKRLNKAAKFAAALVAAVDVAADEQLKHQCTAYMLEMEGRAALLHGNYAEAKEKFIESRVHFHALCEAAGTNVARRSLVLAKSVECDDRIIYCMQSLGEDASSYRPPSSEASRGSSLASVPWLGRNLQVHSIKVKELLREAEATGSLAVAEKILQQYAAMETSPSIGQPAAAWWLFQNQSACNKAVDALDKTVVVHNEALDVLKQEKRDGLGGDKTQANLLGHYLSFNLNRHAMVRLAIVAAQVAARFELSELFIAAKQPTLRLVSGPSAAVLGSGAATTSATAAGKKEQLFTAQHVVSPLDAARLYDSIVQKGNDTLLLPGVEGSAAGQSIEVLVQTARCDRLYYLGRAWAVSENPQSALEAFHASGMVAVGLPNAVSIVTRARAAAAILQASAVYRPEDLGASSTVARLEVGKGGRATAAAESSLGSSAKFVADRPAEFVPCEGFARFPPDFQSMPCKPTFVDVASTYLALPTRGAAKKSEATAAPPATAAAAAVSAGASSAPVAQAGTGAAKAPEQATPAPAPAKGGWFSWMRGKQ